MLALAQEEQFEKPSEFRPRLAGNAEKAERERLPEENVRTLEVGNLFKVMVPRRWGGYGATLPTALETFAELAEANP